MLVSKISGREKLAKLHGASPQIVPSLLLCDFGNLAREIEALESAGIRALHLDVMDGHFVPNLTYGLTIVEAISRLTDLVLDTHLMISNPGDYIQRYRDAGADIITIHAEAVERPQEMLAEIRSLGAAAGLAINPSTPLSRIDDCLDDCDMVLVMSVNPGFGGQQFEPVALKKLSELKARAGESVILEVDGGVNEKTIRRCSQAGADWFVAGSAIFQGRVISQSIENLTALAMLD